MSATIHYRKTNTSDPYIKNVMAPSAFINSLEKAFGGFPCELSSKDIDRLEGMAAMISSERDNPYKEIIEIITKFGSVELYAKY